MSYLDSLLKEKNSDQHAKKFPGYSRKSSYDSASIENSEKEQHQCSPDTNPENKIKSKAYRVCYISAYKRYQKS